MHVVRGRYCPATYAYHAWAVRWSDSTVQRWMGCLCFEQTSCLKHSDAFQPWILKKKLMFCFVSIVFFLFICAAEHFSSRTRWNLMVIPNIKIKPIPDHLFPRKLVFSSFLLLHWASDSSSWHRSVWQRQHPFYSLGSLIPFLGLAYCAMSLSRMDQHTFFLQCGFFFSQCYLSLLPTSGPLGWCYWCSPHRISPQLCTQCGGSTDEPLFVSY